jgi:hypothetical protein
MRNSGPEVLSKQKTSKKKLSRELGRLVRRSGLRGWQGHAGRTVSGAADAWRALQRVGLRDRFRSGAGGVRASPCHGLGPSSQRHGEPEVVRAVVFESHWSAWGRLGGLGFGVRHMGVPGQRCNFAGAVPYLQGNLNRQTQPGVGLGLLLWCYTHHLARGRTQDPLGWRGSETAEMRQGSLAAHHSRQMHLCLGKEHSQWCCTPELEELRS